MKYFRVRIAVAAMGLCSLVLAQPASIARGNSRDDEGRLAPVSYDLKVTIEPAAGTIAVRGKIEVPLSNPDSRTTRFALHETFAIKQLSVDGRVASFSFHPAEFTPINPATRNVLVVLPSDPPHKISLEIEYGGRLREIPEFGTFQDQKQALDDQINSRLVELANYSSWYPQFFEFGRPIEVRLEVSLPQGWVAICSGKKLDSRVRRGRVITQWSSPTNTDILIAASPNYKERSVHLPGIDVETYYTRLPDEFVERDCQQIADVMKLFTDRLGETANSSGAVRHVFSPKRRGQGRAGIARPGMIVTSEGRVLEELANNPKFSLFQDIAHEIAHLWWNFGGGQGDWINEAFAEYFSALAVEKIGSEQQFESVLENQRTAVRGLGDDAPSLSEVPFNGSGFVIRYYKGSLMLNHLRHVMGDARFFQACRDFFQTFKTKSIGTEDFRMFWEDRLMDEKDALDVWLDSAGGLPELARE